MKITIVNKPQVTDLAGEKVMVDFNSGKYFLLKGTANDIWDAMEDGVTSDEIVAKLLEEYDVEEEVCRTEVESLLRKMEEYRFIKLTD